MKTFEHATIAAVNATYLKAQLKHPDKTLDVLDMQWYYKFSALAEEFGEVSELFTYDKIQLPEPDQWRANTINELLQLAGLALAWVESLDHGGQ